MKKYAYYTYTITNTVSLALLGVIGVVIGSLWINYWALLPPPYPWVLQRVAWPLWGLAFVIRAVQFIVRVGKGTA